MAESIPWRSHMDEDDDYLELIKSYVKYQVSEVAEMKVLFEVPDWKTLGAVLHKLRGSSAIYGFETLSTLSKETEILVKEGGEAPTVQSKIAEIEKLIESANEYYAGK